MLVGGGSLASANISHLIFDSIRKGKALHPDSLEPLQWSKGLTIHADQLRRDSFGYLHATLSADSIYIRKEDGTVPSDQTVVFKASFAPMLAFFSGTGPTFQELESTLISIAVKLVMGGPGQQAAQAS